MQAHSKPVSVGRSGANRTSNTLTPTPHMSFFQRPVVLLAILLGLAAVPRLSAQLVAGWNFNDSTPPTVDLIVDHGTGTLSLVNFSATAGLPTGTTVNAYSGDPAGDSLAATVASFATNGYIQINFSTTGTASPILSYAIGTTVGTIILQWAYSTDGSSFTSFGGTYTPATITSTSDLSLITGETVDLTGVGALTGRSQVYLRGTFSNSGLSAATLVVDNIQVNAAPIPEPATVAALAGLAVLGLGGLKRRRKSPVA